MAASAIGAKRMSTLRYFDVSRLAAHIIRNPRPRIKNDRRAPVRLTRNPALVLIATISRRPVHVWGACSGASPRLTLNTNADWIESINPARQTAHIAVPAKNASTHERKRNFQE